MISLSSRWSFRRALVLLAAANLLLGAALFSLRPPGRAAAAIEPPPPLPAQVEQIQALIAEGRHGEPYALDLSEKELTATVAYFLARSADIPFGRVRIAVRSPYPRPLPEGEGSGGERVIVLDAVTRGLAVTVPVRVTGTVAARDGLPVASIHDVSLGDTPLPGFARDQVLREANAALDFSKRPMDVTVDSVELRPGGLTIRGTVK